LVDVILGSEFSFGFCHFFSTASFFGILVWWNCGEKL
jgi:hypothetical protein